MTRRFALTDIRAGRLDLPRRILGYGVEGVGKSTFGAGAPDPVFLCPENGTPHLDIRRLPTPSTWDELLQIVSLVEGASGIGTLVVDPVNWLELLAWARVVGGPNAAPNEETADEIAKHGGGYGKGHEAAVSHWRTLVAALERVWSTGKHVILLGHAAVKSFTDPTGVAFDRYELQMHAKAAGILKQWVDDLLFMRHEVLIRMEKTGRREAVATGARVIHTQWSRAWDAKSRASLPEELPLSWADYWTSVAAGKARAPALLAEVQSLAREVDTAMGERALSAAKAASNNPDRLAEIVNKLRMMSQAKEQSA